jgi:two-component system cell cycle sensor histidine kinase/response regulator CckA
MTHALVVDDNRENLYLLRALLQGSGFTVDEANNGADALARAGTAPPDLIISDLLMPVMDGFTLLRRWKADEGLRSIPFIVYTATYTDPKDQRLALDLGVDAFILKPAEPDTFMACIRDVLEKRSCGGSNRVSAPPIEETILLKEYSEVLVRKLEKKAVELEEANRALKEELSERKRAEERIWLQASLLDQVRNAVLAVNTQGYVTYWNKFAETLFQWTEAEAVGRTLTELIVPKSESFREQESAVTLEETGFWEADCLRRRKDGTTFPALVFNKALIDAQGRKTGVVSVEVDITERHRLEAQYRQAQKMEVVGKLAGGVAHDFNNLLTVINGYADLVYASLPQDFPTRGYVREIGRAGERAALLTRQLLALSRQKFLTPKVLDVNSIVDDCKKMLPRLIGEDVKFTAELEPALHHVRADAGEVEQVLLNLVVNARDAMPRGGSLRIRTRNAESDETRNSNDSCEYAVLEVIDTGVGMPQAIQSRIFEPFFTTKGNRGTGLGLATVHDIVTKRGGHVDVVSAPGSGSTFTIYLPRAEGTVSPGAVHLPESAPSPRGTETVIVAEDDEGVRTLTRGVLQKLGYHVLDANRGSDALAISDRHSGPIHLLITDVVMPEMSGRELADHLVVVRPELKVLYLSGYSEEALLHHGMSKAEMAFLQKPFTPAGLAIKVRERLDAAD